MAQSKYLRALLLTAALFCAFAPAHAGVFDDSRFKQGMVYELKDIDQLTGRHCTGNLFGLNDDHGRNILPKNYSDIEYCGHGIFLATDVQSANKYFFGDRRHFFNREGVELHYELPEKAYLLNIFSFGEHADLNDDEILTALPPDALLLIGFRGETGYKLPASTTQGLCDLRGKLLFKTRTGTILFLKPGFALIDRTVVDSTILNLKNLSEKHTDLQRAPGTMPPPRIKRLNNYAISMPFPKDRLLVEVSTDNGKFDHDYWCDHRESPIYAIDMFNRFLHDYDLIHMLADKVDVLLGEPETWPSWAVKTKDSRVYRFPSFGCIPHLFGVKVYTENEHVTGWSFIDGDPMDQNGLKFESPKVVTNVVLNRSKEHGMGGLNLNTMEWPETQPK